MEGIFVRDRIEVRRESGRKYLFVTTSVKDSFQSNWRPDKHLGSIILLTGEITSGQEGLDETDTVTERLQSVGCPIPVLLMFFQNRFLKEVIFEEEPRTGPLDEES